LAFLITAILSAFDASPFFEPDVMQTTKTRLAGRLSRVGALFLWMILGLTSCSRPVNLPTDEALITQWEGARSELRSLTQDCATRWQPYNLAERYQERYPLLPTTTAQKMEGCEVTADAAGTALPIQHLAKLSDIDAYLLVTHQYRQGTGLIEESISQWTRGWISWKTSILEEKGFVYVDESDASVFELPLQSMTISDESLDQFSGRYRVTSQVSGNGCEAWRLRPVEDGWYLFYRQVRECAI